jgi:hypothetical protein
VTDIGRQEHLPDNIRAKSFHVSHSTRMQHIFFLTLSALLLSAPATGQEAGPTPTTPSWITPSVTLPSPYDSPSIYVTTDSAGSCEALLQVYFSRNCKLQTTVYPSSTTISYGMDCLGCSTLTLSVRHGLCPLGGHHSSYPDTILTTPSTKWSFVCAPTPAPDGPLSAA